VEEIEQIIQRDLNIQTKKVKPRIPTGGTSSPGKNYNSVMHREL
jgi:hypothetical protein